MTGLGGTSVNAAWPTPCASPECRVEHARIAAENDALRSQVADYRLLAEQLTDRLSRVQDEQCREDARNIRRAGFKPWPNESGDA